VLAVDDECSANEERTIELRLPRPADRQPGPVALAGGSFVVPLVSALPPHVAAKATTSRSAAILPTPPEFVAT
jgi:hypothetical protein